MANGLLGLGRQVQRTATAEAVREFIQFRIAKPMVKHSLGKVALLVADGATKPPFPLRQASQPQTEFQSGAILLPLARDHGA